MQNRTNANACPEIDGAAMSVLTEHRGGQVVTDLSAAIRKVTDAVQRTGKSGSVVMKIKVATAQNAAGTLVISDEIDARAPKETPRGSIFYADDNNNLVRNDPNQADLPLKIVESPAQPATLKTINA